MARDPASDATALDASLGSVVAVGGSSPILDDDASFLELLLLRPDLVGGGVVFFADGRSLTGSGSPWPVALGWRARGGPALVGVTTGVGPESLLVETLRAAGEVESWSLARWDEALRDWWDTALPELRERVAERWSLPPSSPWQVGSWTEAAWGAAPIEGRAAVGIVATRVPESVVRAIEWIAGGEAATAFRIQWYGVGATPTPRLERVAGNWPGVSEIVPSRGAEPEKLVAQDAVAEQLVAAVEARCLEVGCQVSRRGSEWVRFDGARSLRVFPGPAWIDLQFVGIDEGTLVGLRYRHGVPLSLDPPPGAPPGVHLRVVGPDLSGEVTALVTAWLAGPGDRGPREPRGEPDAAGRPRDGARPRKPRNTGRRKPRR